MDTKVILTSSTGVSLVAVGAAAAEAVYCIRAATAVKTGIRVTVVAVSLAVISIVSIVTYTDEGVNLIYTASVISTRIGGALV